jgi:hypothetical protein
MDSKQNEGDTPPNSFMDSIPSPKVKTTEREGVEGHVGAPGWD